MEETRVYGDRYEVRERVGRGGQASVFKAWDNRMNREVALKVVRFSSGGEKDEVESTLDTFRHEIFVTGRLNHPNIIQVHDFGLDEEAGAAYMVMQYLDGRSLKEMLATETPPTPEQAFRIIVALVRTLHYLHQNDVIHRDIKPSNVFWQHGTPVIIDFGISTAQDRTATLTGTGVMGSQPYLCPEMVTREASNYRRHPRRDAWGLGMIAFELCTGSPLFDKGADQIEITGRLANARELFAEIGDRLGSHPLKKLVMEILRADSVNLGWCDWWNAHGVRGTRSSHTPRVTVKSPREGQWKTRSSIEKEKIRVNVRKPGREGLKDLREPGSRHGDGAPLLSENVPPKIAALSWNWGAFGLNWLWCFNHGKPGLGVALIFCWIFGWLIFPAFIALGILINLGANGHKIAWKSGRFKTVEEHLACQTAWFNWFIGIAGFFVLGGLMGLPFGF